MQQSHGMVAIAKFLVKFVLGFLVTVLTSSSSYSSTWQCL